MNSSLLVIEFLVALLGLGVLMADLWLPPSNRRGLAYLAATGLLLVLTLHVGALSPADGTAFKGMFVVDPLANFFKALFLVSAIVVVLMSTAYAERLSGYAEYVALIVFATVGMLLCASANDFVLLFVALELVTVTFYVLVSFQRSRLGSLEAGVKYLVFGALSAAFMVFGITLIFGAANATQFDVIASRQAELATSPIFLIGLLLTLVGLGFKISAFPFQMWTPDVYQGAPTPTTAFLATGSKAAGFVLLIRLAYGVVPELTVQWSALLLGVATVTVLYGSLCALAQRSVKRLMGYSGIANAGYLLLGVAAANLTGSTAVLYYLAGYVFTTLLAFSVISVVTAEADSDDISVFAGLGQRSPFLAGSFAVALVSLAGIPPLAGFVGKFALFRSVANHVGESPIFLLALLAACAAVVISMYYYFTILRTVYWPRHEATDPKPLAVPGAIGLGLATCAAAVVLLGLVPDGALQLARQAVAGLSAPPALVAPAVPTTAAAVSIPAR